MPSPRVRVCHAWCARIVKFVGRKAVVDGKVAAFVSNFSRERRLRSSRGRARRMVNDFTMNWPPKRRPLTSEMGLNE